MNSGPNGEWRRMTPESYEGLPTCTTHRLWCHSGGVQVLVTYHGGTKRMLWTGYDEYLLPDGTTRLGKMIDRDEFERINDEARDDPWRPPTT